MVCHSGARTVRAVQALGPGGSGPPALFRRVRGRTVLLSKLECEFGEQKCLESLLAWTARAIHTVPLCWAMQEAAQHHAPLTVMTVCPSPARPATMTFWGLPTLPEGGFNDEHARQAVQEAVDKAASEISGTAPEVTVSVATGRGDGRTRGSVP